MAKPIESYDHPDKERTNNPPAGLVTAEGDPDLPAKDYRHLSSPPPPRPIPRASPTTLILTLT